MNAKPRPEYTKTAILCDIKKIALCIIDSSVNATIESLLNNSLELIKKTKYNNADIAIFLRVNRAVILISFLWIQYPQ